MTLLFPKQKIHHTINQTSSIMNKPRHNRNAASDHDATLKSKQSSIKYCSSSTKDQETVKEQIEMSTITDASSCSSANEVTSVLTGSRKRKSEEDLEHSTSFNRSPKKRSVCASLVSRESSPHGSEDSDSISTRFTYNDQVKQPETGRYQAKLKSEQRCDLVMAAASALTDLTSSSRNQNADGSDTSTDGDDHLTTIPKEISTDSSPSKKILDKRTLRFPVKLMNILSCGEFDDIIEWTPDGLSFVVNKPKALVEKVFPLYFKKEAVQYSSFTRKLHRWGFIKIMRGKDLSAFCHRNFKQGEFDLCEAMRCSKPHGQEVCYSVKPQPNDERLLIEHHQKLQLQRQLEHVQSLQHQQMHNNLRRLSSSHLLDNGLSMLQQQRENSLQHTLSGLSHYNDIANPCVAPNLPQQLLNRASLLQSANLGLSSGSSLQTPLINSARFLPELQSLTANDIISNTLIDNLASPLPSSAFQGLNTRSRPTQYNSNDMNLLSLLNLNNKMASNQALLSTIYDNY